MKYRILADGKQIAGNVFRPWILGENYIQTDIENVKKIVMEIETDRRVGKPFSLMLADACVITRTGERIHLSSLNSQTENVALLPHKGKDYQGGPVKIAGKQYMDVVGIEPVDSKKVARLVYDIESLDAVRLEGVLGNDFFVGNEEQLRKTVGVRQKGKEACFLTLIEPFEKRSMVKSVHVVSANEIEVVLADGRVQRLYIEKFYGNYNRSKVRLEEWKDGQLLGRECTHES